MSILRIFGALCAALAAMGCAAQGLRVEQVSESRPRGGVIHSRFRAKYSNPTNETCWLVVQQSFRASLVESDEDVTVLFANGVSRGYVEILGKNLFCEAHPIAAQETLEVPDLDLQVENAQKGAPIQVWVAREIKLTSAKPLVSLLDHPREREWFGTGVASRWSKDSQAVALKVEHVAIRIEVSRKYRFDPATGVSVIE